MDVTQLIRDRGRVMSALKKMPDGSVVALEPIKVYLPKRFEERGLADITETVETIAVIGLVLEDNSYCSFVAQCKIRLSPGNIRESVINSVKYYLLEFEKGDTVIKNLEVPMDSLINYHYFMEFVHYAKIPWYLDVNQMPSLFDNAVKTTGKGVGTTPHVFRVIYSITNRDPESLERAYRTSEAMVKNIDPIVVGLNNTSMLTDGTFNKLIGGYMGDNIVGAILNPDDRVTVLEKVIKGIPD